MDENPSYPIWKGHVSQQISEASVSSKSMKRKFGERNLSPGENFKELYTRPDVKPPQSPVKAQSILSPPHRPDYEHKPPSVLSSSVRGLDHARHPQANGSPISAHFRQDALNVANNDRRSSPREKRAAVSSNHFAASPTSNSRISGSNVLREQHIAGGQASRINSSNLPANVRAFRQPISIFEESEQMPLKAEVFKERVKERMKEVENHHSQCAAAWIARAGPASARDRISNYTNRIQADKVSPFAHMGKIQSRSMSRSKPSTEERTLAFHVPSDAYARNEDTQVIYTTKTYTVSAHAIPPYTHYISTKRNILVEGVRQRTFLPYLGEDDENLDEDYKNLQKRILENQDKTRDLMDGEEFGSIWLPYVHSMLKSLSTSVHAVLKVLLDYEATSPPRSLPRELHELFSGRKDWISEGFYEEEDDVEVQRGTDDKKPERPQKRWQNALKNLPSIDDRELAAAVIACWAFMDVALFSLWHVVRQTPEAISLAASPRSLISASASLNDTDDSRRAMPLQAFWNQACLVCKAHQCFCHGEYSEDDEEQDVRVAMTSGLDALTLVGSSAKSAKPGPYRSVQELQELLGRSGNGLIVGKLWTTLSDERPGLDDSELCSDRCFWDKRNRVADELRGHWSKEETELLQTLGPGYVTQRRGACALSRLGVINRNCVEIFNRLIRLNPPRHIERAIRAGEGESTHRNKPWSWWNQNSRTWQHEARAPFKPCNHVGVCKDNPNCSCDRDKISCEKSCNCSKLCARRFRGCQCAARGKPCYQSETCDCFKLNRECDPDVCQTCGAHEVLDPANRYEESATKGCCCNVTIQKALPKRTLLGQSKLLSAGGLVGWGLFMGETARKGDYVGEYVGEIVRSDEADQRGIIYNAMNLSYLFDLNEKQVLDSTPLGNKLRYINHQGDDFANCKAKVMFCAGVQRIGMFATKNIEIGEELLFNYGESFAEKINMVKMHKDGSVTIDPAKRNSASYRSGAAADDDDDDDEDDDADDTRNASGNFRGKGKRRKLRRKKRMRHRISDGEEDDDDDSELEATSEVSTNSDDEGQGIDGADSSGGNEDEDDDEDVVVGPRKAAKWKQQKKRLQRSNSSGGGAGRAVSSLLPPPMSSSSSSTSAPRPHILPSGMSGSDRMRKAWITRYQNLGKSSQAQAQRKKYEKSIRSGKHGSKLSRK